MEPHEKIMLSSYKVSYFRTFTSLSLVMVSICSLRTGSGHWILSAHWHHRFRENQPFGTKNTFFWRHPSMAGAGRKFVVLSSRACELWMLDFKASTFDVILAGIFAAILKRNHAITDHFQIIRTIHPINEIGGPSNQI